MSELKTTSSAIAEIEDGSYGNHETSFLKFSKNFEDRPTDRQHHVYRRLPSSKKFSMVLIGAFLPMLSGLPLRVPDLVQAEMALHGSFISELSFKPTFIFIILFEA